MRKMGCEDRCCSTTSPASSSTFSVAVIVWLGIIHSFLISCEAETIRSITIPHNVPVGYQVTQLGDKPATNIIIDTVDSFHDVFDHIENGAIITKTELTDLAGKSFSLAVKNSLNDKLLDSFHITIDKSKHFIFPHDKYVGTIKENEKRGSHVSIIGHLSVIGNANVTYRLLNSTDLFSVETVQYGHVHDNIISALTSFNREEQSFYTLNLEAHGSQKGEITTTVLEIHILDVNDNIPKFRKSLIKVRSSVDELWNRITKVRAIDNDSNERITYSLEGSVDFVIDPRLGEIYADGDYMYPGSYSVVVYATDSAGHRSDPLHVRIELQSDTLRYKPLAKLHAHHLTKRATTTIKKTVDNVVENTPSSVPLFSISSIQPRPPTEKYKLLRTTLDIFNQPDFSGNVYLQSGQRLDFENPDHRQITLEFERTNSNFPDDKTIVEVILRVQDKNDEKPVFKNKPVPFLAAVSTNPGMGENVYTLYAEDADLNHNLTYNLESGGEGKFRMLTERDPETGDMVGKIVTTVSGPGQFINGVEFEVVVSAQDMAAGTSPPQKSEFALIKVLVGLRPPQLFENPFRAIVFENSGTAHRILDEDNNILQIRAKCFQDVRENKVSWELTEPGGRISSLFSITNKGHVETLQNLDYETPPNTYTLDITATEIDTGLSTTSQLIINVKDVNDNNPKFQLSTYTFRLSEDTPLDSPATSLRMMATDRDSGMNGQLEYFVSDDHFNIQTSILNNQNIGYLRVAKTLDYDTQVDHQYRFNVTARDKGTISKSGMATVIVYVTNVNDEAPVFDTKLNTLYADISEEQTVGGVVTIVQATDPDGDNIQYFFSPKNTESPPFRIDPKSGLITLTASLPESVPSYTLNITAYDDGSCCPEARTLSSETYVVVEIKDTNNNQPRFPNCNYEPEVLENQNIGTFVVKVTAEDEDRGNNGNITYSIFTSSRQPKQFEVNPTNGQIITAMKFDRETQGGRGIPVTVKAADQGQPQSLDTHCTFWVTILDENDNPPVFDSPSYSTSISESSATIGRRVFAVRASDKDTGRNAEVVYSLTVNPDDFFRIESETGIIYLDKPIHSIDNIVVRVKAEDQGVPPKSALSTVTISITDRKNNPPTWDSDNYERNYEVKETAPIGYIIATMRASSNTPAPFDGLSFALIDSMEDSVQQLGPFRIHQDGNMVTLILKGVLDFNEQNKYELRLRVTNQGQTPLSVEIRPVIVIKDMNNESPRFEGLDPTLSNSYRGSVPENEPPGQTVLRIKAVDRDFESPNNEVSYSLMEDRNGAYMKFAIDSITGLITTRSEFDRETQPVYYINVMAVDGINSDAPGHFPVDTPNSATAQVQVIIADKNDNPPYFTKELWEISVPEQRPDSTGRILTVTAMDKDEADQLAYRIKEGNDNKIFGIKQKTGDIYVAKTLDYETKPTTYTLTVLVQDGMFENSTTVIIHVTDINDNAPEFSHNVYDIDNVVEETVPPYPDGQFLVQVSATDKDVSRENIFKYYIFGDGTTKTDPTFTIESDTGRIYLHKKLDRDAPNGREVYQFNVIAEDEPDTPDSLFGYAYVKVSPKDINDNAPVFRDADLQGNVPEHSPAGQSVMTVVAKDSDAGENSTVFYEIDRFGNPPADPSGELLFQIDSETGLIQTKLPDSIDRERTAQYYVPVVAKDRGVEQKSSSATVTIAVSDINDQVPKFVQKIYRVSMSENQKSGPVVKVSATDNDIDENARLTYGLEESDLTVFSIKTIPPNAGVLTVYNAVDYEKDKFFNLTVYVQDNNPDHRDVAYIEVTVEDYNDNAPEFSPKVKTMNHVKENIAEGTSLWNCTATDNDDGVNALFEYSIDRSTDPGRRFTVDSKCEVKIRQGLDGETLDREALSHLPEEKYEVHILATDKGYPPQTGTATLRLFIDDVNDNAPEFVLPHPPMVMELQAPPQFVITFSARDRDTPKYGAPFLFSLPPCEENPTCQDGDKDFDMVFDPTGDNNNGTGTVTAMKMFFRSEQKFHYLPIIMSDMRDKNSPESKTGTSTLTIEIGDENDNRHYPGHKDIFVYKYDFKGVESDLVIGNVYAEDPDDWDVKDKHFYFHSPPVMQKYFSVDYDDGLIRMNKDTPAGIHKFKAKVWDYRVFTKYNVTCTVTVTVEEITDEAIFSSGSIRITGMTAEDFIKRPSDNIESPYEKFRAVLADKLRVSEANVNIFSVQNGADNTYTDIRYAAHGSPYYPPSKLNGIVTLDKQEFESATGISVTMVNIDMCLQEVCESGGCTNVLKVGDMPNYVNSNGTSFIGISTDVVAECVCRAHDFSGVPACVPGYCHNGGRCEVDEWGDVSCVDCPANFDGPRCQMTRHSFNEGYALYAPFEQCEESVTSIEFVSHKAEGLIFYNGPVTDLAWNDQADYIALSLVNGYPELQLDHGSGVVTLTLDGLDRRGERHIQMLDDGKWHHIDIIRKGKEVTMTLDRCESLQIDIGSESSTDRSPCEVTERTPGENLYLNVNTMLQLGGRYTEPAYPDTITTERFKGCVRNLIHNGQLYDLNTGQYSKGENHYNGCPEEEAICGVNSLDSRKCGPHGICEMTDMFNREYKCTCKPGYRTPEAGTQKCDTATTVRDLEVDSFMSWTLKNGFVNNDNHDMTTQVQLNFRTRDHDGILLHLPSNTEEFITLELVGGHVSVLYNLGGADGESSISLANAPASNGQWHTLYLRRIGKWFQLKMDGGEGRYHNETYGSSGAGQLITIKMYHIVAGAHVVFSKNPIPNGQDLNKTCVNDIRVNGKWFPMINSENELSEAATLEYEENVLIGCHRDDCKNVTCPAGIPFPMVCHPLWGTYDCRCPAGTLTKGIDCLPINYCERDQPCFDGATCITKPHPTSFTCVCPSGWTGRLCNILSAVEPAQAGLTTGFIVIIIICIFVVLIVALLVFLIARYKKRTDPEKYMLDVDIDDDIRENVINYNEEGAGEEDQQVYDIHRLRKPDEGDTYRKHYDPLQMGRYPGRPGVQGNRPDVGDFIDDRLNEADNDPGAPPHDNVREFVNEGGESDVGSLSSLQTSSSTETQDYDYLNDWGPKFSKLATLYVGDDEDL